MSCPNQGSACNCTGACFRRVELPKDFSLTFTFKTPATKCVASKTHSPKPLRFIWHHILPQTCGGQTVPENLAELCDNCHYGVHAILFDLATNNGVATRHANMVGTGRYRIAKQGYDAAVAAGVVSQIPDEGSH